MARGQRFVESHAKRPHARQSQVGLRIAVAIAAIAVASVLVWVGVAKLEGEWTARFELWGYRPQFALVIGCLELAGALALVIPATSAAAALGLILIMIGALETHLLEADWLAAAAPALMIALLAFVLVGRGLSGHGRM